MSRHYWRFFSTAETVLDTLRRRGLIANITNTQFPAPGSSFYIGFDPTAASLHIGNLTGLIVATHLKNAGYAPIILVGGATARIGDPSFRDHAKDRIEDAILMRNTEKIKIQLKSLIDATIIDNYEWQRDVRLLDFLDSVGSFTRLSSMLGRESVQKRLASTNGMSFTEFTYQLLQAYDYLHLMKRYNCRLQVGGSDQWGNIVAGVELIGKVLPNEVATGMTFPLLTATGGRKMGKSDGNAVWLDSHMTCPFDLYQYLLRLPDADAERLFPMMSLQPLDNVNLAIAQHKSYPDARGVQKSLASELVAFVHGKAAAEKAMLATKLLFDEYEKIFSDHKALELASDILRQSGRWMAIDSGDDILSMLHKLVPGQSNNNLRTLLKSGGIYINGNRINSFHGEIPALPTGGVLIRIGKHLHFLVDSPVKTAKT